METIVAALADQMAELDGLLSGLGDADWQQPSRCEGWTVADVVLHLAQTNEMASGSAQGRFADAMAALTDGLGPAGSVDDGAALMVDRERGQPGPSVHARWQLSAETLVDLLRASDPHARLVWVAGELSARTLATTRLAETWIHTGDVADALGTQLEPTDRLWHIARLAWRTLPYAFAREGRPLDGAVAFRLRGPSGQTWDFEPDSAPSAIIEGDAAELCLVAARRLEPRQTGLRAEGPQAEEVLELVRTYA